MGSIITERASIMYGELVPVGGGDAIPLLKKSLLVGRRESCDIVLRFSNVSAHHCQLTVNAGYWYLRDMQSRNGVKVNGVRVTEKRLDPGDILSVAKHKYEVRYSPARTGGGGSAAGRSVENGYFQQIVAGAGGVGAAPARRLAGGRSSRVNRSPTTLPRTIRDSFASAIRPCEASLVARPPRRAREGCSRRRLCYRKTQPGTAVLQMAKKKKIRAEFRKNRNVRARPSDWTRRYQPTRLRG